MATLSTSVTLLVISVWVQLVLIHGKSCREQGLLSCQFTKECYDQAQRCDGAWDCSDKSDEADCSTDPTITKEGVVRKASLSKGPNLAWLITPILLLLGVAYGIYKCVKDGVCGAIKRRLTQGRRSRESRASDYHPLHQVSFYTSTQIPCNQLGINPASLTPQQQQQLMLVHNQSFSIQIQGQGAENLGVDGAVAGPPTYEEAMSAVSDGKGGTIVMMKNGRVIAIPQVGILPPPYANGSTSRSASARGAAAGGSHHMEAIEEVEELEEEEQEDDDIADNADEQTFFLPKDSRGDGNVGGRRRHNSQWSNKQRSESRRRHHSCPS